MMNVETIQLAAFLASVMVAFQGRFPLTRPTCTHVSSLTVFPERMIFSAEVGGLVDMLAFARAIYSIFIHCRPTASHVYPALATWARDTLVFQAAFLGAIFGLSGTSLNDAKTRLAVYTLKSRLFYLVKGATILIAIMGIALVGEISLYDYFLVAITTSSFYLVRWCVVAVYVSAFFPVMSVFANPVAQKGFSAPASAIDSLVCWLHFFSLKGASPCPIARCLSTPPGRACMRN